MKFFSGYFFGIWIYTLRYFNDKLKGFSCRLLKFTGRSRYPIHPKHLFKSSEDWYVPHLGDMTSGKFLDIGSGVGSSCMCMALRGFQCFGLEYSDANLSIARSRANDHSLNVCYIRHDLETEEFPFSDHMFDFILFQNVIEHFYF
jgi:2-polyprenyl-3-methyl-5-hydroxy-6-metoxy-1,4-benzoquinol methylase